MATAVVATAVVVARVLWMLTGAWMTENHQVMCVSECVRAVSHAPATTTKNLLMMEAFFAMYKHDVADEDALREYKDGDIDLGRDDKMQAIVQTKKFYDWLDTAAEESDSEPSGPQ